MNTKSEPPVYLTSAQFQLVVVVTVCLASAVAMLVYVAQSTPIGFVWPLMMAAYPMLMVLILLVGVIIRCTPQTYRFRLSIAEILVYMTIAALCLAAVRGAIVWANYARAQRKATACAMFPDVDLREIRGPWVSC